MLLRLVFLFFFFSPGVEVERWACSPWNAGPTISRRLPLWSSLPLPPVPPRPRYRVRFTPSAVSFTLCSDFFSQLLLVETQAHTFFRNENELVVPIGELGINQAIALLDLDCDDAAFADVGVIGKIGFFDDAGACRKSDMEIFVPCLIDRARSSS